MNQLVNIRRGRAVGLAVLALLGLAVVAAPTGNATTAHKSATATPVTFVGPRSTGVACLTLGKRLGFFKKEGLQLTVDYDVPIPQLAANVISGRAQFAALTWANIYQPNINGVPLVIIGQDSVARSAKQVEDQQWVTLANSP